MNKFKMLEFFKTEALVWGGLGAVLLFVNLIFKYRKHIVKAFKAVLTAGDVTEELTCRSEIKNEPIVPKRWLNFNSGG
jgi:hypothetical protein